MTLLGKIFTVLIFIMSIGFMTVSVMVFATHKDWKLVALNPRPGDPNHDERFGKTGLRFQIEDATKSVNLLRVQKQAVVDQLERERASRRMAIQQLQQKYALVAQDLEALRKDYNETSSQNGQLLQQVDTSTKRLEATTLEVEGLRKDIQAAQQARDREFQQVVLLTDQLHQYEGMKRRLEERRDQLALEVAARKRVMDHHGLTKDSPVTNIPPAIDGYITKVSEANKNLVEISLGGDDGIRVDHELVVYREARYLGRIKILKVDANVAVGQVLVDTRRGTIRKGDNVTTRLS